jgi:hypothetical protein
VTASEQSGKAGPSQGAARFEEAERSERSEVAGGHGAGARSVAERALDLFVYLPVGVLLTAVEDTSEAVAKGRTRVDQEVRNAQVVGRFAVDLGLRQLKAQIESITREVREARDTGSLAASQEPKEQPRERGQAGGTRPPARRSRPVTTAHRQISHREASHQQGLGPRPDRRDSAPPRDPEVDRAIPDYDILAASQVVRRLDGLDHDELRAVLRHEQATRARRAVIQRAEELLERPGGGRGGSTETGGERGGSTETGGERGGSTETGGGV